MRKVIVLKLDDIAALRFTCNVCNVVIEIPIKESEKLVVPKCPRCLDNKNAPLSLNFHGSLTANDQIASQFSMPVVFVEALKAMKSSTVPAVIELVVIDKTADCNAK